MNTYKKELTAVHGAITATAIFGVVVVVGMLTGAFKPDPVQVEAAKVETARLAAIGAPVEIGRTGATGSIVTQRIADKEAGNWCYILDSYRSLSCVPANSATIYKWAKEKEAK